MLLVTPLEKSSGVFFIYTKGSAVGKPLFTCTSFEPVGDRTHIHIPKEVLQNLPCGVFRATAEETVRAIPELRELIESFPVSAIEDYEFDVKIHMLMPDQFPCIPNWHCDNVPRDSNGTLDYAATVKEEAVPMLIWLSGTPCTEFLRSNLQIDLPDNHIDLADQLEDLIYRASQDSPLTTFLPTQQWVKFRNTSPHRGVVSTQHQWRIFVRATHKSISPVRHQEGILRRHCQVYLDSAKFGW